MATTIIINKLGVREEIELGFNYEGKPTKERVNAFLSFASEHLYHDIKISSTHRSAELQNKLHIAHMMVYNSFVSRTPKHTEPGKRNISWKYLSDVRTKWFDEDLRDRLVVSKNGSRPFGMTTIYGQDDWVQEPDKEASIQRAIQFLIANGVGAKGKAMVACGYQGCVEPCKCGGSPSKHITGQAIDLNSAHITLLTTYLVKNKLDDIDVLLKKFGLHRPLIRAKPPEIWHLESI